MDGIGEELTKQQVDYAVTAGLITMGQAAEYWDKRAKFRRLSGSNNEQTRRERRAAYAETKKIILDKVRPGRRAQEADDEVRRLKSELERERAARLELERCNAVLSQENQKLKRERGELDSEKEAWKRHKEYVEGAEAMTTDASASSSCGETLVPPTSEESSFTSIEEVSDEVNGLRSPAHGGLFDVNRYITKCLIPYLGSKSKLVKNIVPMLEEHMERHRCDRVVSTCLGAGHVEFYMARSGKTVVAHDLSRNVVNLWHQVIHDNESVQRALLTLAEYLRHVDKKAFFERALETIAAQESSIADVPMTAEDAARFIFLTRSCYKGMAHKFCECACNNRMLRREDLSSLVAQFKGMPITLSRQDIFTTIAYAKKTDLLFIDPPYLLEEGKPQYMAGSNFGIDAHTRLRDALEQHEGPWALCHRDEHAIRELYKKHRIVPLKPVMQMSKRGATRNEILVLSCSRAGVH